MLFKDVAFGLSVHELSQITYRHPSTIRRYLRSNKAPPHVLQLVSLYRAGRLPSMHKSWRGWRVDGAWLIDPDGNRYRAEDVQSLWAVKQLRRELEKLQGQPVQFLLNL
jgi:hypothetical protein